MKVTLNNGRIAQIGVQFGDEQPQLERPPKVPGPFRSVRIKLTVTQDGKEVGTIEGVSYCNPGDQFNRFEGRRRAMKRLLERDSYDLLSKEDRRTLVPAMLASKVVTERKNHKKD
jgi:hypothetical protein